MIATRLHSAFALFFSPAYAAVAPGEIAGPGPRVALPDSSSIKEAMNDFKSLSRKEKKERFKDVKKELKAYKAAKKMRRCQHQHHFIGNTGHFIAAISSLPASR